MRRRKDEGRQTFMNVFFDPNGQPNRRFRAVTPEPKVEPKPPRPTRAKRGPKLSALAAVHRVLQEADSPMNCKQITETAAREKKVVIR